MADKILTSDNIDYKSPFSKNRGILLVKKISVASDETFGGPRYELGTNQAAPNDIIHLSPRMDRAAYAEALALCPKIAEMTWNDQTKRSLTLVTFWDVSYKIDSRAFGKKRTAEVKTATHIVATDKPTADKPGTECDTVAAVATMEAYEAAQRATAETTTDELTAYLRGDHDDELTTPKETTVDNWATDNKELGKFWKAVNEQNSKFAQWREMKERIDFVHTAINSKLHDTTLTREQCQDLVIHAAKETWGEGDKPAENKKAQEAPSSQPSRVPTADNVTSLHQSPKKAVSVEDAQPDKKTVRKENTIKISGKDYLKAAGRVIMWKLDHPDWTLETDAVSISPDFAVFKASILNSEGRVVSTGHGMCTPGLSTQVHGRFVEKAETAAISRALALAGYGTDDTLDDSDYISDSPISRAS